MSKDLDKELRRLNIELARLSDEAHDLWVSRYTRKPAVDIDERRAIDGSTAEVERRIQTLEKERDMVRRAIRYRDLAREDEDADGYVAPAPKAVIVPVSDAVNLDAVLASAVPIAEPPKATPKTPARRGPGRPRKVTSG